MDKNLTALIDKYLDGTADENEAKRVDGWYQSMEAGPGLMDQLSPEEAAKAMAAGFARIISQLDLKEKAQKEA